MGKSTANIGEIMLSSIILTYLLAMWTGPRTPEVAQRFDVVFAIYSILYGLLAIWEKSRGKGSWFEVVFAFLVYYGYGAVYGGVQGNPNFNQYTYAVVVAGFWTVYNSVGEVEGLRKLPGRIIAFVRSKIATIKLPKLSLPTVKLPKLPDVKVPTLKVPAIGNVRPTDKREEREESNETAKPQENPAQSPSQGQTHPFGRQDNKGQQDPQRQHQNQHHHGNRPGGTSPFRPQNK